ncbi:MAG: AzlD domain-containing protein [Pseudomonadota bacterium]
MGDFFLTAANSQNVWLLILLTGLVTYITRSAGHVFLARFKTLHPRVEAALEAVPGAVLVTLVLPPALSNGPVEMIAMLAALVASFRLPPLLVMAIGLLIVIVGRAMGF